MGERAGSETKEFQTDMDGCQGACASIADCAAAVWVVPGGADGSAGDCWMKSALTDVYASRIEHRIVFPGCETKCPEDGRDLLFLKKQKNLSSGNTYEFQSFCTKLEGPRFPRPRPRQLSALPEGNLHIFKKNISQGIEIVHNIFVTILIVMFA